MPYAGSTTPTRTRRMTSPKVGLSGSGSCRAHERTWSSNCLISTAPMSGVVMSVFSQLAHLTTNTCHRRSDIADAPGLRRLCADQTQIRRPGLPEVLTAEDVRARLDPFAARESVGLATEDVGPRLDGALGCRRVLAAEDVRMGG